MHSATFRFYAELNDFLPPRLRQRDIRYEFSGAPAIKDAVEAQGVPHTEVEVILVDGTSVRWDHHLQGGERVAVLPMFEALDVSSLLRLRPRPLRNPRFVLDVHLGRLARYLRLLGFDSHYTPQAEDAELSALSAAESRVLLTRDRGLLKRSEVTRGYCVRQTEPARQMEEVVERFDLWEATRPFTRCLVCNGPLEAIDASRLAGRVPPRVLERQQAFSCCRGCGRVYWPGSHHAAMLQRLEELQRGREEPRGAPGSRPAPPT